MSEPATAAAALPDQAEPLPEVANNLEGAVVIFADGVAGMTITNGVAKINLFQSVSEFQPDGQHRQRRLIAARLVMSPITFALMADWFVEQRDKLIQAGFLEVDVAPTDEA